jgi:hypothetical protein
MRPPLLRLLPLALLGGLLACSTTPSESRCLGVTCGPDQTCEEDSGKCAALVSCSADAECPDGGACVSGKCAQCGTTAVCVGHLVTCEAGACARCSQDSHCGAPTPFCVDGTCESCRTDADCSSADAPACVSGRCQACDGSAACAAGRQCSFNACTVGCQESADCPADRPYCGAIKECAECRDDGDCAATEACHYGSCVTASAADVCRNAREIALGAGSVLVQGDVTYFTGEDLYLRFTLAQEALLNVDLSNPNDTTDPGAYLQVLTGSCERLHLLGGASGKELRGLWVPAGTSYLRLSSRNNLYGLSRGRFDMRVWTTPGTRAQGNHCLKEGVLPLGAEGLGQVRGTTEGMHPIFEDTCDARQVARGPDMAYRLTLPVEAQVELTALPLTPGQDLAVLLKDTCVGEPLNSYFCGGTAKAGEADSYSSNGPLPAGEYTVMVRDLASVHGEFELSAKVLPWAANDRCADALPLSFEGDVARVQADTTRTLGSACLCPDTATSVDCSHAVHYRFSTRGLGNRSVRVKATPTTAGYRPELSLASGCAGAPGAQGLACSRSSMWEANGVGELYAPWLPEGDYVLSVGANASGTADVEVALGTGYPPPANDTCAGMQGVTLVANEAQTLRGDTRGASPNGQSCGASADVVYRVDVPAPGLLRATVTPDAATYDPVLSLMDTCDDYSAWLCSADAGPGTPETLRMQVSQPGSFFLWVDGAAGTRGTYSLTTQLVPPPANDACAAAATLPLAGAPLSGTLTGVLEAALDDPDACWAGSQGPDVFYRVTAPTAGTLTVTLQPDGFDGRLMVRSNACDQTPSCSTAVKNAGGVGAAETVSLTVSRNTTYLIQVWGTSSAGAGAFTLGATLQ